MSIEVRITAPVLQEITKGQEILQITSVTTFTEALNKLEINFPGLKKKLYKSGEIDPTLDILINGKSVCPDELSAQLHDKDKIDIIMIYCFPRS